jgi:outer membrane cobalamin receptor
MNLKGALILFLSPLWLPSDLQAQEDSATLTPVVVTATRTRTPIDRTPAAVSYLTAQQIREQNGRSVPEMLMPMAGVWMQKTNHAGGSPFLRGLTGNQVLIMTDGIRLNNATYRFGPNQYLSTIDPFTVSGVEAFRGVGGTLYGSDAIGGVININTTEPTFSDGKSEVHGSLSAKWMSRNMEKTLSSSLSYSTKNWHGKSGAASAILATSMRLTENGKTLRHMTSSRSILKSGTGSPITSNSSPASSNWCKRMWTCTTR